LLAWNGHGSGQKAGNGELQHDDLIDLGAASQVTSR
jgi:hypothetical protein